MEVLSLQFLAAKSGRYGSNQLLAVAFTPTRNFTCYSRLLEPHSLQTLQEAAEMNSEISTFTANPYCAKTVRSAYQQDVKALQSLRTVISNRRPNNVFHRCLKMGQHVDNNGLKSRLKDESCF